MKIIDLYILKRYLVTFSVMLMMFIPIGITIDVSEKVNKMIEKKIPFKDILVYYGDFTIYFANLLFPIFLFLSIIWFTSKLANNTEIIAILSSGISFGRFLRPFIYGAIIVSIFSLIMGFFLVPKASKGFNDFRYQNLKGNNKTRETSDIFRQIKKEGNVEENIYVSNYNYLSIVTSLGRIALPDVSIYLLSVSLLCFADKLWSLKLLFYTLFSHNNYNNI